ncbi:MAG TPA: hypothetical protein VEH31_07840, partial [Streptosporangiaceae bacterium]|nr:hypothetical protein [Streptosporangiaceae bacterium]
AKLATFLRETLGLELNSGKTLITHARSQPARFLGYDTDLRQSVVVATQSLCLPEGVGDGPAVAG